MRALSIRPAVALAPGAFERCRGVVRYAPAFTAV
jgi:hypothetical protein